MITPRAIHNAILLGDGKVLAFGGENSMMGYLTSAELYDPSADIWTSAASMSSHHRSIVATVA